MATKKPSAEPVAGVSKIDGAELAQILADRGDIDLGGGTILSTETIVEDFTDAPVEDAELEYESADTDLGGGTILTSVGELKE